MTKEGMRFGAGYPVETAEQETMTVTFTTAQFAALISAGYAMRSIYENMGKANTPQCKELACTLDTLKNKLTA